jgi:hypothetical protein
MFWKAQIVRFAKRTVRGGVLRELQAGLRVPGVPGDVGEGGPPGATVDRAQQSAGPAQCLGDAVARRVLRGRESQKQDTTCPNLTGAVHSPWSSTVLRVALPS